MNAERRSLGRLHRHPMESTGLIVGNGAHDYRHHELASGPGQFCVVPPAVDALEFVLLEMYLCNSVYLSYGLYN